MGNTEKERASFSRYYEVLVPEYEFLFFYYRGGWFVRNRYSSIGDILPKAEASVRFVFGPGYPEGKFMVTEVFLVWAPGLPSPMQRGVRHGAPVTVIISRLFHQRLFPQDYFPWRNPNWAKA